MDITEIRTRIVRVWGEHVDHLTSPMSDCAKCCKSSLKSYDPVVQEVIRVRNGVSQWGRSPALRFTDLCTTYLQGMTQSSQQIWREPWSSGFDWEVVNWLVKVNTYAHNNARSPSPRLERARLSSTLLLR